MKVIFENLFQFVTGRSNQANTFEGLDHKQETLGLQSSNVTSQVLQKLRVEILQRTKLPLNWDGHRGIPVAKNTAEYAIQLAAKVMNQNSPFPSIGAGSGGQLFMEWYDNKIEIELGVWSPDKVDASRFNLETEEEQWIENVNDFTLVSKWISELTEFVPECK